MSNDQTLPKGSDAEELLREYFLGLGYFVVRGAKLRFMGDDVTDVDLWLPGKAQVAIGSYHCGILTR